jgi:hypothetical protein
MSEILNGFFWLYTTENRREECKREFAKDEDLEIDQGGFFNEYYFTSIRSDLIQEVSFETRSSSNLKKFCEYILKKYEPEVLIFSHDNLIFVNGKKVNRKKAYDVLKDVSPKVKFNIQMQEKNYESAIEMLKDGLVTLDDQILGAEIYERCFVRGDASVMAYAIENGYHNHLLYYDEFGYKVRNGSHVIHRLIYSSSLEVVELALKLGSDPNGLDEEEHTLLHKIPRIAFSDEFNIDAKSLIKLLGSYGANVNKENWDKLTPILCLAEGVDTYEVNDEELICELLSCFIEIGAHVDVYDKTGAGLLIYFSRMEKVKELLFKLMPGLSAATDSFDMHRYILSRAYIDEEDLEGEYGEYFITCLKFGFIEYLLEENNINIVKKRLNSSSLHYLIREVMESPGCVEVLKEFHKHEIPIFLENTDYGDKDSCNSIYIANRLGRQDVIDFFNSLSSYKTLYV